MKNIPKYLAISFLIFSNAYAYEESKAPLPLEQFHHFSLPLSQRLADSIMKTMSDLDLNLEEFFFLRGTAIHSIETTKLKKDEDGNWVIAFVSTHASASVIMGSFATLEKLKDDDGDLLPVDVLSSRMKGVIKIVDPDGKELMKFRGKTRERRKKSQGDTEVIRPERQ